MIDIRIQVFERKEIFELVLQKIDTLMKTIPYMDRNNQDAVYDKLLEVLTLIKENVQNAEDAIVLLYHFMQLDEVCCENIDTDGFLEMAFLDHATDLFVHYAELYQDKNKLTEIVNNLIQNDDYGCRSGIAEKKENILKT